MISRRHFINSGLAAGIGSPLLPLLSCSQKQEYNFSPFKVGISTYAFRKFSLRTAIENIQNLSIDNIAINNTHVPFSADEKKKQEYLNVFLEKNINPVSYGIVDFKDQPEKNRRIFQFVRDLEINLIIANPEQDALQGLYNLCGEFGIALAIHNGGPGSQWESYEEILAAWPYQPDYVGACVNTGNYMKANQNPATAIKQLQQRVFSVHLNDFRNHEEETVLGGGALNLAQIIGALTDIQFPYHIIIDTALQPDDPTPTLVKSLGVLDIILKNHN